MLKILLIGLCLYFSMNISGCDIDKNTNNENENNSSFDPECKETKASPECDDMDPCTFDVHSCDKERCYHTFDKSLPGCDLECSEKTAATDCNDNDNDECTNDTCEHGECLYAITEDCAKICNSDQQDYTRCSGNILEICNGKEWILKEVCDESISHCHCKVNPSVTGLAHCEGCAPPPPPSEFEICYSTVNGKIYCQEGFTCTDTPDALTLIY